ncbi:MAG: radical SAM protein [Candidatus Omnitrophota bacterium]|nr:radical SAM protein [Candidatus Omnitrophota bacterium]
MDFFNDLKRLGFPRLIMISVDVTTSCNLQCPHCIVSDEARHSSPGFIDVDRFTSLIPELVRLGCRNVNLAGGEPLMHQGIRDIIRSCKQAGLNVVLYTNGTLLDESFARFLRTYPVSRLIISHYGASDEEYSELSAQGGASLFSRIRSGVKAVRDMGIPYHLQVFCFKDKPDVHERLLQIFPEEKTIPQGWLVVPESRNHYDNQRCMISAEDMAEHFRCRNSVLSPAVKSLRQYLYEKKASFVCGAGLGGVHVTSDFKIKPCLFIKEDALTFSLDLHSLEEIFFEKMPVAVMREISPSSPCYDCSARQYCCRCAALGYGTERAGQGNQALCRTARVMQEKDMRVFNL